MPRLNRRTLIVSTAALAVLPSTFALAATSEVQMLNKNPDDPKQRMVFYPRILTVQPGDSVTFLATDRGHNSASIKGMLPDGAEAWNGKINKEITVEFSAPGFYGYKCTPHETVGMVGLIIVEGDGKLANLEAAKGVKHRGRSKKVWAEIWAEADEAGLTA
ncbi:MAG: pseudoazurin [Pseudomonadota bacterium]